MLARANFSMGGEAAFGRWGVQKLVCLAFVVLVLVGCGNSASHQTTGEQDQLLQVESPGTAFCELDFWPEEMQLSIDWPANDTENLRETTIFCGHGPANAEVLGEGMAQDATFKTDDKGKWSYAVKLQVGENRLGFFLKDNPEVRATARVSYYPEDWLATQTAGFPSSPSHTPAPNDSGSPKATVSPVPDGDPGPLTFEQQTYLDDLYSNAFTINRSVRRVSELMTDYEADHDLQFDDTWRKRLFAEFKIWHDIYWDATFSQAPPELQSINNLWIQSLQTLTKAAVKTTESLDDQNVDLRTSGEPYFSEFLYEFQTLEQFVDHFKREHGSDVRGTT